MARKINAEVRVRIGENSNWLCGICGYDINPNLSVHYSHWAPVIDHIIPKRHGGTDDEKNLQIAHFWCNQLKGAKLKFKLTQHEKLNLHLLQIGGR